MKVLEDEGCASRYLFSVARADGTHVGLA